MEPGSSQWFMTGDQKGAEINTIKVQAGDEEKKFSGSSLSGKVVGPPFWDEVTGQSHDPRADHAFSRRWDYRPSDFFPPVLSCDLITMSTSTFFTFQL